MGNFDVIIIGAGPAGLFTAHYLLNHSNAHVLLLEKGYDTNSRGCIQNCSNCIVHDKCSVLCGVGGAGLFSDGKLVLDLNAGGHLDSVSTISNREKQALSAQIEKTLRKYDGKSEDGPSFNQEKSLDFIQRFNSCGFDIKYYGVTHIGTDNLKRIIFNFIADLKRHSNFHLLTGTQVINIERTGKKTIVLTNKGESFSTDFLVFAVGKTGSSWMQDLFDRYQIEHQQTQTYIGIRLETKQEYLQELFTYSFDPKIWTHINGHKVKTHCFCRHGDIICTNYLGVPIVGGHTKATNRNMPLEQVSERSSFNILVSINNSTDEIKRVLDRFGEKKRTGLSKQTLGEFMGECSSSSDSFRGILNDLGRSGDCIAVFISALNQVVPGVSSPQNTVYAPALEWFMDSVQVDQNMETSQNRWYAIGDGAGLSQGIMHSAATGVIAAKDICSRLNCGYATA